MGVSAATASGQAPPTPVPATTPVPSGGGLPTATIGPQVCDSRGGGLAQSDSLGLQSLLGLPCIRGLNAPTLYERFPSSAYQFHSSTNDWLQSLRNALAGWLLDWVTGLGSLCAALLEWVFALQLAGPTST